MADQAPHELDLMPAPDRTAALIGQPTDAATRTQRVPMPMLALETLGSAVDANVAMEVGAVYAVDLSVLTAARNFTLPATFREGDKCGLYIVAAGSHPVNLLCAAGDTINMVDHSAIPYVSLGQLGDFITLTATKADAEWLAQPLYLDGEQLTVYAFRTITSAAGFAGNAATLDSAGDPTFTPNPLNGNRHIAKNTGTVTIADGMVAQGEVRIVVPANTATISLSAVVWSITGSQDGSKDCTLYLTRDEDDSAGVVQTATWVQHG